MAFQRVVILAVFATVAYLQTTSALSVDDINEPGKCANQLVSGFAPIPSSYITASSTFSGYPTYRSRFTDSATTNRCWAAATNAGFQWIQYRFPTVKQVTGIALLGRGDKTQFVRTFRVLYGESAASTYYREAGTIKTFQGNAERNTMKVITFNSPVEARYIRIVPMKYFGWKSLRADILGC